MATSSFYKNFVVSNPSAIKNLNKALDRPRKIESSDRDYESDKQKAIELFKRSLSRKLPNQKK